MEFPPKNVKATNLDNFKIGLDKFMREEMAEIHLQEISEQELRQA